MLPFQKLHIHACQVRMDLVLQQIYIYCAKYIYLNCAKLSLAYSNVSFIHIIYAVYVNILYQNMFLPNDILDQYHFLNIHIE